MRLLLALAATLAINLAPAQADPIKGVVELFTSQGCSSCPPADRVLAELAQEPNIITLSLPVDYWDRLGWKDTFGSPVHSERQRVYSSVRGDGEVYTPQAVINGQVHVNGSSRSSIDRGLSTGGDRLPVALSLRTNGGELEISVGSAKDSAASAASIIVMPVYNARKVEIGRGENANSNVTYTNIVRGIETAGKWGGEPVTVRIPAGKFKEHDAVVVLLQTGGATQPGAIVGAARLNLR
jgi:hypothetical protein